MIKKLDEYFNMLSEAFNNPLKIKWINKDDILIGVFSTNNNTYSIKCINKGYNIWKYDFFILNENDNFSPELTNNEKDKYRVLPTVKSGIQYLLDNKKVDAVIFGATDKSKGRKKLYESFCEEFSKLNNLEFYTNIQDDKQIFIMFNKNINKKTLIDTYYTNSR